MWTTAGPTYVGRNPSCKREGICDYIKTEMNETVFEDTTSGPILCDEFRAGEKSDKEEGTVGGFCMNVGVDICET